MATAILRSQDCLRQNRFNSEMIASGRFAPRRNADSSLNSANRKRSPTRPRENGRNRNRGRDRLVVVDCHPKNLVMGQVKILKRGEELKPAAAKKMDGDMGGDRDFVLSSTDRLGPEPEMVQKQIRVPDLKVVDGIYAASSFFSSPPPSSVPLPGFFAKKEKENDAATSDLRRLLRLDLL